MTPIKKKNNQVNSGRVTISNDVKDHSTDPFVLKKVQEAKAVVSKLTFRKLRNNHFKEHIEGRNLPAFFV
jgi:hypothetical protein